MEGDHVRVTKLEGAQLIEEDIIVPDSRGDGLRRIGHASPLKGLLKERHCLGDVVRVAGLVVDIPQVNARVILELPYDIKEVRFVERKEIGIGVLSLTRRLNPL